MTASDASFVLHAQADYDVLPLRPGEVKLVAYLRNLSRSLEDLRTKAFLPDDELVTFLYFLLVIHNVFRLGEDTSHLEPLGEISPEERLLREPRDDDAPKLSPFASRLVALSEERLLFRVSRSGIAPPAPLSAPAAS